MGLFDCRSQLRERAAGDLLGRRSVSLSFLRRPCCFRDQARRAETFSFTTRQSVGFSPCLPRAGRGRPGDAFAWPRNVS